MEEEIGWDEILRYKITEKIEKEVLKKTSNTELKSVSKIKFPLIQWLNENWKGSNHIPNYVLKYSLTRKIPGERKVKDVLKNDFGILNQSAKRKRLRIEKMSH